MAGTTSELSPGGLFSSDTTTQAGSISESAASAVTDATAEQSQLAAAASETAAAASAATASTKASEAATSATNAASSATTASGHATTATTKASEASSSASTASGHKDTATTKASEAATSATNAATSASTASTQASNASTSASTATTQANTATTQASTATTKASEASTSATNAASSATAAASSATAAASSATASAGSATTASGHKDTATTKASEAATSATNAANSATTASTQATNSSNSASTASTQATTATNKAADAGKYAVHAEDSQFTLSDGSTTGYSALHWNAKAEDQKTAAATSATNAASSATAAASSATSAAGSATTATTQATNASNSATTATTKANTATTQATTATTKASEAATSATNAASSASTASTQATNSSNSASSSATAQAASEAARDAALAALDSFDDRYLGVKSSAPSVDNDGDALAQGALYFDSGTDSMKVYDGSNWLNAYASLSGALIATNNLSDLNNAGTARTNLGVAIGSNVQAHSSVLDGTQQSFTTALKNKLDGVATSANAYVHPNHSGEVTSTADGATVIADNIVDEANLKVSNSPTNGYFLSAQSGNTGGLTWAVPTDTQYSVGDGGLTQNNFTNTLKSKLDAIEASATADQTDAEIRAAVEAATDSNVFTDADHTKLNGIEASATADQTAAEIKTLVESASDSNVFTDADHSKLDAIEASADVTDATNVTAAGALMDSEVTNLAQVKAFDSSDYATAAQGTLATNALPKSGGTMTGAIEMGSNAITSASHLNIDAVGQIFLDGADDGNVQLRDTGTQYGAMYSTSGNWYFKSTQGDKDIIFQGVDGSSQITALTLDMSAGGNAIFNDLIKTGNMSISGQEIDVSSGDLTLDVAGNILLNADGGGVYFQDASLLVGSLQNSSSDLLISAEIADKDIIFRGIDGSSTIDALKLDMSDAGTATFNHNISVPDAGEVQLGADGDFRFFHDGSHNYIKGATSDQDIIIQGNDGGNIINVLTLDMSDAGKAIFSGDVQSQGLYVGSTNTSYDFYNNGTSYLNGATIVDDSLTVDRLKSVQATVAANSSSTALDFGATNNFMVNMTADTTFSFSNLSSSIGCSGNIVIVQDGTGGRDFTLPSEAKTPIDGATIVQNTGANEISVLSYYVMSSSQVLVNYIGDFA